MLRIWWGSDRRARPVGSESKLGAALMALIYAAPSQLLQPLGSYMPPDRMCAPHVDGQASSLSALVREEHGVGGGPTETDPCVELSRPASEDNRQVDREREADVDASHSITERCHGHRRILFRPHRGA